jgi:hypothetical protein
LQLPMSQRTEGDTRAIAVSFARVTVDPTRLTTDLHDLRANIKQALTAMRETPDESPQILWLTPFMPKRALKRLADAMDTSPDLAVSCSNLGDMGSVVCRLDGTYCEYGVARGTRQHVTRQWLERVGGQMNVVSLRAPPLGKIFITVLAYQPGAENTRSALAELAARTLAEFDLTGEIT